MTTSSPDPAHILFPDDAPKPTEVPEYFKAQTAAAETRLMGGPKREAAEKDADDTAGQTEKSQAEALFPGDVKEFDGGVVSDFLDHHALSAIADGEPERAEALQHATSALTEDFKAAGTSSDDLKSAFEIVREANDFVVAPTPEKIEADMHASLATLQSDLGSTFESDLTAARAFIRDLEIVAPGTVDSLNRNGAGNNLRLVHAAIKEAKRRGYGARR